MRREKSLARQLSERHRRLCFQRAFPKSSAEYHDAAKQLTNFAERVGGLPVKQQKALFDSGIAGTRLSYRFSLPVALWLARKAPRSVSIDWPAIENIEQVDDLLRCLLQPAEDEYFDSGYATCRDWLDFARGGTEGTDFDWLMAQIRTMPATSNCHYLYEAADLPLVVNLGECDLSRSKASLPVSDIQVRKNGMRRRPQHVKREIARPFKSTPIVSRRRGAKLLDVAMASLAVRHRETNHFNHANPAETYEFDVGEGVSIVVFGLLPGFRYPLECTMGFLILANGVPIGYGGSSALFKQLNTGINIFDEYRGSEAAYLWVQVMRVFHYLTSCTRFVINPYQFGGDNTEALQSGAFWFYYRLGFRPIDKAVLKLAEREAAKRMKNQQYRSDRQTLRALAACDMHLAMPGSRRSEFFDEEWLVASSKLATDALAQTGETSRRAAVAGVVDSLARKISLRNVARWSPAERQGLQALSPVVASADPSLWSKDAKRLTRELLRAKGGPREASYAKLLAMHEDFRIALQRACRLVEY